MTVLAAMQDASVMLIGRKPAGFFGSNEKFETELTVLVNEVAEDIAQYQDWQALQTVGTLSGNGIATAFDLPSDYGRMMVASDVQSASYRLWGYFAYDSLSEFMRDQALGFRAASGGWIISGGKIQFNPAPRGNSSFAYISSNWAKDANGARKAQFTADDDTFVLPERLLKLALIWRWREQKKLDATGDQEAFTKALDEYAVKDEGSKVLRYNGRRSFPGTHTAWPWPLG